MGFVCDRDRPACRPGRKNERACIEIVGRRRDSRKEVKILSHAADHHSRFGREPRERFFFFFFPPLFFFFFFILPLDVDPRGFRARETAVDLHAISYRLSPIESGVISHGIDARSSPRPVQPANKIIDKGMLENRNRTNFSLFSLFLPN